MQMRDGGSSSRGECEERNTMRERDAGRRRSGEETWKGGRQGGEGEDSIGQPRGCGGHGGGERALL